MNKYTYYILFFLVIFTFSCKRQKINLPTSTTKIKNLSVQEIDFKYFSSRSKVTYTDSENNLNAIANIRIKKDSLIWISVSKIGVEGVRALITQDSILVVNRLKNEFTAYDFKSLSEKFNFNITFDIIQAAIVGNLPLAQESDNAKLVKEKDHFLLRQSENSITIDNFISANTMKLTKLLMIEQPTNNSLTVDYGDFKPLNTFLFPYSSIVSLQYQATKGNDQTSVNIQHQKVEITDEELKFPFDIPQKYDRK
ncbi:DUF4292 domain-containing protein [Rhodocytophaga aerolata]|uniref:DUF4292 domain-containing protein n=1 Tax=Rhodocytophaga aerolata TaxID=455078 RepID=A0ABT8R8G3_9BACT|nr:DUF4292 domain-containing protein [Rhodocytophaga aerolata]MDO1447027.1 DUF4292 domain-containing protein [Rhodocytophaga aerolata]